MRARICQGQPELAGNPDLEGYVAYVTGFAEIVGPDLKDDDNREIDLDLTERDSDADADADAEYGRRPSHSGSFRADNIAG